MMSMVQNTLGERYLIEKELGRGGMGVVYEAEQISLHRRVALKILMSAETRKPLLANGRADHAGIRAFGQECVLIFKIGRGDDPAKYPLEFGDYF